MAMVFVYGPDSLQGRMYDRLGSCDVLGGARLPGYRLSFDKPNMKNEGEGLANLAEAKGESTFGVLYELSRKQVETLEGYYGGYNPKDLPTYLQQEGGAEKKIVAQVLIARRTAKGLKPTKSARSATIAGAEENGAPEAFIAQLKTLESIDG
jgi:hypothetical protein